MKELHVLTMPACPCRDALEIAVAPKNPCTFTSHPLLTKNRAEAREPASAAQIRGVLPVMSTAPRLVTAVARRVITSSFTAAMAAAKC